MAISALHSRMMHSFVVAGIVFAVPSFAIDDEKPDNAAEQIKEQFGPLRVTVRPRQGLKQSLPVADALASSYVALDDGYVVSLADWVMAPLRRQTLSGQMNDYENRFFLGQVGRALLGYDEKMTLDHGETVTDPGMVVGARYKGMGFDALATALGHDRTYYARKRAPQLGLYGRAPGLNQSMKGGSDMAASIISGRQNAGCTLGAGAYLAWCGREGSAPIGQSAARRSVFSGSLERVGNLLGFGAVSYTGYHPPSSIPTGEEVTPGNILACDALSTTICDSKEP